MQFDFFIDAVLSSVSSVSLKMSRITGNTRCKSPIVGYDDADKRFVASAIGLSNIAIALKIIDISNLNK